MVLTSHGRPVAVVDSAERLDEDLRRVREASRLVVEAAADLALARADLALARAGKLDLGQQIALQAGSRITSRSLLVHRRTTFRWQVSAVRCQQPGQQDGVRAPTIAGSTRAFAEKRCAAMDLKIAALLHVQPHPGARRREQAARRAGGCRASRSQRRRGRPGDDERRVTGRGRCGRRRPRWARQASLAALDRPGLPRLPSTPRGADRALRTSRARRRHRASLRARR